MLRTTLRAFACALMTTALLACPASAATGDSPTITNATTGALSVYPGNGTAVGDVLHGNDNDWAGIGVYNYQWHRCADGQGQVCDVLAGATSADYTTVADDYGMTLKFCATVPRGGTSCSPVSEIVFAQHQDADADGVPDYKDACPTTTASTSDGCAAPAPVQTPPADSAGEPAVSELGPGPSQAPAAPPASDQAPVPNGTGANSAARITVLVASRSRATKVGFRKRAVITGRLVGPGGTPIRGAVLNVLVRRAVASAHFAEVGGVVTGADGRFSYVAPPGTSRVIRFAYRAFANDTAFTDTTDVTLLVRGALTLNAPKAVKNGKTAVFSGQLRGKPVPAGGVLVDLQVKFRKKWRTFATPRTNKKGAFRFKYRFTQGSAKWLFRARIRKDSAYPFELAYSSKRAVRVRR